MTHDTGCPGQLVTKLLLSVDDTKLLQKTLLKEISVDIGTVFNHVQAIKVLLHIFTGNQTALQTLEVVPNMYSKKDDKLRNQEIVAFLLPSLAKWLEENVQAAFLTNSAQAKLISTLIKIILTEEKKEYMGLVEKVVDLFSQQILFKSSELLDHPDS